MDQFVLVPASVYNKSLISQSVTKQELPKYQPSQNPTYQIDSLKKEINKKWFSKTDSSVDKILSPPRINLSNSQTLILDGVENGIFLSDFAQQLRRKNADVPDLYFTLLDAAGLSPTLILNQNAKAKARGSWVPFKIWTSEAAETVHTGWCCILQASNLSVSNMRQFFHSKLSETKFSLATREFKRMKAFARFKNENWCMVFAYVDIQTEDNNGVKYLLVRQELFDRTVDAKGMKTKDSKETARAFLTMITKKNRPKKNWVDKGTDFAGEFKKLCKAEVIQIYSRMSETKAAFAERTIRSLKNILYRYMEDKWDKYIHKLT